MRISKQMFRRSAFTLVELLVVIGIIAVLMGILLPSLSAAREQGRRAVCGANLRNWGIACHSFAAEHKGRFPMCYHHDLGAIWPSELTYDSSARTANDPYPNTANKTDYEGITLEEFVQYGVVKGQLRAPTSAAGDSYEQLPGSNLYCPSATTLITTSTADGQWGSVVWMQYMYVGGLDQANMVPNWGRPTDNLNNAPFAHWGNVLPARRQDDSRLQDRILAADEVSWFGPMSPTDIRINHRLPGTNRPSFQNVLYGDGHVDGHGREYWPKDIDTMSGSNPAYFSTQHWTNGVGYGFFYWNGTGPNSTAGTPTEGARYPVPPNPNHQ